jgi:hypothetical protein
LIASAALVVVVAACGPRSRSAAKVESAGQISPSSRTIQITDESVMLEGSWHPVAETDAASHAPSIVKTTCLRATRRCREELTTARDGALPSTESFDYRVEEWTKAKLVATRRDGRATVQIRVALTGLTAGKSLTTQKGKSVAEIRWRLE